ncbi:MAG: hypothetical protein SFX73_38350 [Kofleriaceae bacterium]|nr:hypothetical protein [Kofleriaceae bacterium]
MSGDEAGFRERLGEARDHYAAQDVIAEELRRRGPEPVAREVLDILRAADTPAALRTSALWIVFSLADEISDGRLAADLLVPLGACETEPPDSALAALARGIARCPEHPELFAAVSAAAGRARRISPKLVEYEARHGRDWLERCVANGTLDRVWLARYNEALAAPARPDDAVWRRITETSGGGEIEALLNEVGMVEVARVIVERATELGGGEPAAYRLCFIVEALTERVDPGELRGRLELIHARFSDSFQIGLPCALRALAELPDEKELDGLIEGGWEGAEDMFTLGEVEEMMRTYKLAPKVRSRVRAAIKRAKRAGG